MKILRLHPWNVTPQQARSIQNELSKKVVPTWDGRNIRSIAAADVSFPDPKMALAAIVVVSFPDIRIIETAVRTEKCTFPYIPGLLAFREIPVLVSALEMLKVEPNLLICDAQGLAHPRKMGLATHIGILADVPSIGCAKSHLYGKYEEPGKKKGTYSYIQDNEGETIGAVLCTRDNVQPVYVSIGHRIDLQKSIDIVLACTSKYRIPDPLRLAHKLAAGEKIEREERKTERKEEREERDERNKNGIGRQLSLFGRNHDKML